MLPNMTKKKYDWTPDLTCYRSSAFSLFTSLLARHARHAASKLAVTRYRYRVICMHALIALYTFIALASLTFIAPYYSLRFGNLPTIGMASQDLRSFFKKKKSSPDEEPEEDRETLSAEAEIDLESEEGRAQSSASTSTASAGTSSAKKKKDKFQAKWLKIRRHYTTCIRWPYWRRQTLLLSSRSFKIPLLKIPLWKWKSPQKNVGGGKFPPRFWNLAPTLGAPTGTRKLC